ncbi:dTDP-4-dehydrorhamnose reductase [Flavobacterium sp. J49]|uniref:dTDP-4-dehydrorhamnose reductase n=1 Tax=Flavobacterium sp. J49 TaxID=2718534 RepID=UPI001592E399|nr:dTDP-4-dehydrorhamnose reductase [Flavobacterium sp. J49]MBF6641461.1 dTDP-4-dehydrorhamnose reductase [Flavobacterium sp. J49]NIC02708.1 dTDP-4-dehydrorhamnose reductase [Flavobacterium sp. J49]
MVILVTGSTGQLGQSLQYIAHQYPEIDFLFCPSSELDITNLEQCRAAFSKYKPQYCINTAAYTAVDKAEIEPQKAHLINAIGAKNLAEVCKEFNTVLLHISTDFVFDGNKKSPYTEEDLANSTGVYGQTKMEGEIAIQQTWEKHFIIRTSWVYSQFGNNFMKTMLRLASERDSLSVVNDQIGTPTNAVDLATVLIKIILTDNQQPTADNFGIYNYSNEGQCSWYEFAQKIFEINNIRINLQPIPTSGFPTPAKRPKFSVLDKRKIKEVFGINIQDWITSLKEHQG